jgi:hypothetical protein
MFSSEDQFRTILGILTNKDGALPSYALYTLLRAACDADVRCRHLLDPAITETLRLARALNERLDNLDEQREVVPAGKHFDDRVAHLEMRAVANGIVPLRSQPKGGGPGKIIGFDEHQMSGVDLFNAYLPSGSDAFRVLSGYVHSKPWVQLTRDRAQPSDDPGVQNVRTDLDVVRFSGVLDAVLDLHDENIGHWLHLAGYPAEVWREAKKGSSAAPGGGRRGQPRRTGQR